MADVPIVDWNAPYEDDPGSQALAAAALHDADPLDPHAVPVEMQVDDDLLDPDSVADRDGADLSMVDPDAGDLVDLEALA